MGPELMTWLTGGGAALLIGAAAKLLHDWRTGHVMKDDTAISRWKQLLDQEAEHADDAERVAGWYRLWYPRLWVHHMSRHPEDVDDYPPAPPDPPPPTPAATAE